VLPLGAALADEEERLPLAEEGRDPDPWLDHRGRSRDRPTAQGGGAVAPNGIGLRSNR